MHYIMHNRMDVITQHLSNFYAIYIYNVLIRNVYMNIQLEMYLLCLLFRIGLAMSLPALRFSSPLFTIQSLNKLL